MNIKRQQDPAPMYHGLIGYDSYDKGLRYPNFGDKAYSRCMMMYLGLPVAVQMGQARFSEISTWTPKKSVLPSVLDCR